MEGGRSRQHMSRILADFDIHLALLVPNFQFRKTKERDPKNILPRGGGLYIVYNHGLCIRFS